MSVRAALAFPIHDENESSFQRSILKPKDHGLTSNHDFSITGSSSSSSAVLKPSLAPKSERKALSTLNNNALNTRALGSAGKPGLGKIGAGNSLMKPVTMDKKPKIQFLPVTTTIPAPMNVAESFSIPADEELVCSGSSAQQSWEDVLDPLDCSLLQYEKLHLVAAADEERAMDMLEQEERDRQRAENVLLDELAKEMTDFFDEEFSSLDYFN